MKTRVWKCYDKIVQTCTHSRCPSGVKDSCAEQRITTGYFQLLWRHNRRGNNGFRKSDIKCWGKQIKCNVFIPLLFRVTSSRAHAWPCPLHAKRSKNFSATFYVYSPDVRAPKKNDKNKKYAQNSHLSANVRRWCYRCHVRDGVILLRPPLLSVLYTKQVCVPQILYGFTRWDLQSISWACNLFPRSLGYTRIAGIFFNLTGLAHICFVGFATPMICEKQPCVFGCRKLKNR